MSGPISKTPQSPASPSFGQVPLSTTAPASSSTAVQTPFSSPVLLSLQKLLEPAFFPKPSAFQISSQTSTLPETGIIDPSEDASDIQRQGEALRENLVQENVAYLRGRFSEKPVILTQSLYDELPSSLRPAEKYVGWMIHVAEVEGNNGTTRPAIFLSKNSSSHEYASSAQVTVSDEIVAKPLSSETIPTLEVVTPDVSPASASHEEDWKMPHDTMFAAGIATTPGALGRLSWARTGNLGAEGLKLGKATALTLGTDWVVNKAMDRMGVPQAIQDVSQPIISLASTSVITHKIYGPNTVSFKKGLSGALVFSQVGGKVADWTGISWLKEGTFGNHAVRVGSGIMGYEYGTVMVNAALKSFPFLARFVKPAGLAADAFLVVSTTDLAYSLGSYFRTRAEINPIQWRSGDDVAFNDTLFQQAYGQHINDAWFPGIRTMKLTIASYFSDDYEKKMQEKANEWKETAQTVFPDTIDSHLIQLSEHAATSSDGSTVVFNRNLIQMGLHDLYRSNPGGMKQIYDLVGLIQKADGGKAAIPDGIAITQMIDIDGTITDYGKLEARLQSLYAGGHVFSLRKAAVDLNDDQWIQKGLAARVSIGKVHGGNDMELQITSAHALFGRPFKFLLDQDVAMELPAGFLAEGVAAAISFQQGELKVTFTNTKTGLSSTVTGRQPNPQEAYVLKSDLQKGPKSKVTLLSAFPVQKMDLTDDQRRFLMPPAEGGPSPAAIYRSRIENFDRVIQIKQNLINADEHKTPIVVLN